MRGAAGRILIDRTRNPEPGTRNPEPGAQSPEPRAQSRSPAVAGFEAAGDGIHSTASF